MFVAFVGEFSGFHIVFQLKMMRARTWFKISSRSVVPKKKARIFHLDHFCTFVCLVVSKSAQSVGGDEIGVFSPAGMARAAAVPVEALEAGDLVGETPRGKKARYAEPAERTPDQKAEEIVKKTLGSYLEKTMLEDLKRVVSKFFKPHQQTHPHEREIPEPCAASPANSKCERACWSQTFSIQESQELDNHARKIECGTSVL